MDWEPIYLLLMHGRLRLRPWEIGRLTMPMLMLALDQDLEDLDKRPPPGTVVFDNDAAMDEYVRRWREQTPAQRLVQAKEKWS